ncbi:unnamed protein product [Cyprideis torosa]|uniref:THD domain-containing protein n=1 Tax=Cyprideis torosa TaxID=163714 RepID=A0A7R8WGQ4_9CRUS|nr:unnamed protein product [Cyprideis torosa]CAG0892885.1 unnamed protein product [Cyprideis torosa]
MSVLENHLIITSSTQKKTEPRRTKREAPPPAPPAPAAAAPPPPVSTLGIPIVENSYTSVRRAGNNARVQQESQEEDRSLRIYDNWISGEVHHPTDANVLHHPYKIIRKRKKSAASLVRNRQFVTPRPARSSATSLEELMRLKTRTEDMVAAARKARVKSTYSELITHQTQGKELKEKIPGASYKPTTSSWLRSLTPSTSPMLSSTPDLNHNPSTAYEYDWKKYQVPQSQSHAPKRHQKQHSMSFVHFHVDPESLNEGNPDYISNGRVKNTKQVYDSWVPAIWSDSIEAFNMVAFSKLRVKEEGVYLLYAQIHYIDDHDSSGYEILANGSPVAQCVVSAPTLHRVSKSNTCYTSTLISLEAGSSLYIKDIEPHRVSMRKGPNSFFGLLKVSNLRQMRIEHIT